MKLRTLFLAIAFGFTLQCYAGINLKNGNFYISYTDAIAEGTNSGTDLKIVRTYNSRAGDVGWFGMGWGSDYETWIDFGSDFILVHENGSGSETAFDSKDAKLLTHDLIQNINRTATEQSVVSSDRSWTNDWQRGLNKNHDMRYYVWNELLLKPGFITRTPPTYGETFALAGGSAFVRFGQNGFQRYTFPVVCPVCGKIHSPLGREQFDVAGKFLRKSDAHGDFLRLWRDGRGRFLEMRSASGRSIGLRFNQDGLVQEVLTDTGLRATYDYKGKALIRSKDTGGNVFQYSYDSNYNLTRIGYEDGTEMRIDYEPKTQLTQRIQMPDGSSTRYEYGRDPANPDNHYWTTVIQSNALAVMVTNKYEYEIASTELGNRSNQRTITVIDGVRRETLYAADGTQISSSTVTNKPLVTKVTERLPAETTNTVPLNQP